MRYLATVTTALPDGRTIPAGQEYDYPAEDAASPQTFSEMSKVIFERDQAREAQLRGEVTQAPVNEGKKGKATRSRKSTS